MFAKSAEQPPPYRYRLYGNSIKSHWPLPLAESSNPTSDPVELVEAPPSFFAEVAREVAEKPKVADWYFETCLRDGSIYLRWSGMFEFLVSADGHLVTACLERECSYEALMTYLLGQVLSFVLIKRGLDPLHCTAVLVNGGVVGILGDSGYGKSSLAAAFLDSGYPIVTDDLLVIQERNSNLSVYPGIPRIKLFPEIANVFLGSKCMGTPMNPITNKLIIPLDDTQAYRELAPLKRLYVLTRPARAVKSKRVTMRLLSRRLTLVALLRSAFNSFLVDRARLQKQFDLYGRIASTVPVKMIRYARTVTAAPTARDAILADLGEGH